MLHLWYYSRQALHIIKWRSAKFLLQFEFQNAKKALFPETPGSAGGEIYEVRLDNKVTRTPF